MKGLATGGNVVQGELQIASVCLGGVHVVLVNGLLRCRFAGNGLGIGEDGGGLLLSCLDGCLGDTDPQGQIDREQPGGDDAAACLQVCCFCAAGQVQVTEPLLCSVTR